MTTDKLIKEINGVLGAYDNRTLDRTKRICKYLSVYQWAVQRLDVINELSNREIATIKKKEVLEKLSNSLQKIDKELNFE